MELPESPTRGFFTLNGATFAVGGTKLYEMTSLFTAIERASGLSNLNDLPVNFASNGDAGHQIEMVSDSTVYCFNVLTNTLTTIADQTASDVVFQDGYFIILDPNTSTISLSELENGLVFDGSAQRNDTPDKWVKMLARPKDICLFGSESHEHLLQQRRRGLSVHPESVRVDSLRHRGARSNVYACTGSVGVVSGAAVP